MKMLACKDMGSFNCSYVSRAKTLSEVKKKMWAHARARHKSMLMNMTKAQKHKMDKLMSKLTREVKH